MLLICEQVLSKWFLFFHDILKSKYENPVNHQISELDIFTISHSLFGIYKKNGRINQSLNTNLSFRQDDEIKSRELWVAWPFQYGNNFFLIYLEHSQTHLFMCQNLGLHLWCDGINFTKNNPTQQFYNFKTKYYFYGVLDILSLFFKMLGLRKQNEKKQSIEAICYSCVL